MVFLLISLVNTYRSRNVSQRFFLFALDGSGGRSTLLVDILGIHHDCLLVNLYGRRRGAEEEVILHWGGLLRLLLAIGA